MGKRGRADGLVEDGRAAVKAILSIAVRDLVSDDKVTFLPYPGIGVPSCRPPRELYYVGTEETYVLLEEFKLGTSPLVITGPRGFGKSSDLRAVACAVYKSIYLDGRKERLISIWNMEAAINNVETVVRDAILFAYLFPTKEKTEEQAKDESGKQADEDKEQVMVEEEVGDKKQVMVEEEVGNKEQVMLEEEVGDKEQVMVEEEIKKISSVDDAIRFIRNRKEKHKETFNFFADNWEFVDETDFKGQPLPRQKQRTFVQRKLEELFSEGSRVWKAASAKSNAVKNLSGTNYLNKITPFNQVQYKAYADACILGKLKDVDTDINFYTGKVPWFLDILCTCCMKLSDQLNYALRVTHRQTLKGENIFKWETREAKATSEELIQANWEMVLELFRDHPTIKEVERYARNIVLDRACYDIEEMGKKDMTFFIAEERRYCSGFINRIYVEAFRSKEGRLRQHAGGAWMPYCLYLVEQQPNINWSDVGWVMEDLTADVVKHRGIFLGATLGTIEGLKTMSFQQIPVLSVEQLLKVKHGNGYYYKPQLYNFPYVDGVILYINMLGHLHIIGLQVTVNVDQHLQSAALFTSIRYLKQWFPDLDTEATNVFLHFVFVGRSDRFKDSVNEEEMEEQCKQLKGTRSIGVAKHRRTFVPLAKALAALPDQELNVVEVIAKERSMRVPKVPLSLAGLWHLKKKEVEEIASQYGISDVKKYNKEQLISALENLA